jgi:hypothetical protein
MRNGNRMHAVRRSNDVGNGDHTPPPRPGLPRNPFARRLLRDLQAERADRGSRRHVAGERDQSPSAHQPPRIFANMVARRLDPARPWPNRCCPLFTARASRLDTGTGAIVKSAGRRGSVRGFRPARRRSSRSQGAVGSRSMARRGLMMSIALATFLIAFICDTEAMARLAWSCVAGFVSG